MQLPTEASCGHLTSLNPAGLRAVAGCPRAPLLTVTPTACRLSGLAPSISWDSDTPACGQEGSQGLEDVVFPGQHPACTDGIEWKH